MIIPKKLKIAGQIYDIILRDRNKNDGITALGSEDYSWNKIWLNKNQCRQELESTFLHEIIEAINGLNKLDLNETQIRVFETMLYQVLTDNKLLK